MGKKHKGSSFDNDDDLTQELLDSTKKSISFCDTSIKDTEKDDNKRSNRTGSELKVNKINIISNEKMPNFSEYLKVANLTSKKDFLMKGLANNASIKSKFSLSTRKNKLQNIGSNEKDLNAEQSTSSSSLSEDDHPITKVNLSNDNTLQKKATINIKAKKEQKPEEVSETESSSNDDDENDKESKVVLASKEPVPDSQADDFNGNLTQVKYRNNRKSIDSSDASSDSDSDTHSNKDLYESVIKAQNETTPLRNKEKLRNSALLDDFESNPKFKSVHSKINCYLDDIANDNSEIYIAQFPKSMNVQAFLHKAIKLDDDTKLKTEEGKFVVKTEKLEQDSAMLLLNTKVQECGIKLVHPVGTITVHRMLKSKRKSELCAEESDTTVVPYPTNLKVRHPLFGADYKQQIQLDENVQKKLDEAVILYNKKLKKKKKRAVAGLQSESNDSDLIAAIFNENKSKPEEFVNENSKKKKKRHKSKSTENVEELLINTTVCKENANEDMNSSDEFQLKTPKKQRRKNTHEKTSVVNSTMMNVGSFATFDDDLSRIVVPESAKKKKRKHKAKEENLTNDIFSEIADELKTRNSEDGTDNDRTEKKSKKKRKKLE